MDDMELNKKIVEAAQHGIDHRIAGLKRGKGLEVLEKCKFCGLFSNGPLSYDGIRVIGNCRHQECPFPGNCCDYQSGTLNSYQLFLSHFTECHRKYIPGLPTQIACPECLRLVNEWESDLEKIVGKYIGKYIAEEITKQVGGTELPKYSERGHIEEDTISEININSVVQVIKRKNNLSSFECVEIEDVIIEVVDEINKRINKINEVIKDKKG